MQPMSIAVDAFMSERTVPLQAPQVDRNSDLSNAPNAPRHTIVVVEDDDSFRSVVCESLRGAGFETLGTPSAKGALAVLSDRKSGDMILVTDLVLHGEGGWSLAQRVRRLFPSVPIVMMSGYIEESVVSEMARHGNISFLRKPFHLCALVDTLKSLSGAKRE